MSIQFLRRDMSLFSPSFSQGWRRIKPLATQGLEAREPRGATPHARRPEPGTRDRAAQLPLWEMSCNVLLQPARVALFSHSYCGQEIQSHWNSTRLNMIVMMVVN